VALKKTMNEDKTFSTTLSDAGGPRAGRPDGDARRLARNDRQKSNARASQPAVRCVHDEIQATGVKARLETAR